MKSILASALTFGLITTAAAAEESKKGPIYVQASLMGLSANGYYGGTPISTIKAGFRMDLEGGYHLSGRHDGLVVGVRQGFNFSDFSSGSTQARLGYDLALPNIIGKNELIIAPYAAFGAGYQFVSAAGDAAFAMTFGAEGRLFVADKVYVHFRPIDLGVWIGSQTNVAYSMAGGAGMSF